MNLESGSSFHGSLHLVDLAGSERANRSEASDERFEQAQHISKSLCALANVIFALAQRSPNVPYRRSKLIELLQSSLGGHSKALIFVHLSPDLDLYSETLSTLEFAERVSCIEMGTSQRNKEDKDVRDLIDQVASLMAAIAKKDEEIEKLQQLRDFRSPNLAKGGRNGPNSWRHASSSPSRPYSVNGSCRKT